MAGNPETTEQYQLIKEFDVVWFLTENGKSWYEEQRYFTDGMIEIAYDKDNIVRYMEKDVTAIRPDGLSVVEVPDIAANRRTDVPRNWMFKDDTATKRTCTAEELQQQTEIQKARLLTDAESVISPLEHTVRLNMATEEERGRLETWERYDILVDRVNLTSPEWPEILR